MKTVFLLGRLIFGGFFVYSGLHHFQEKKVLAQYAAAKNVPLPDIAVTASGAMLMLGGASILLGVKPKIGALAMMGRVGDPDDIANATAFFASPESGWVTGQVLAVDGGRTDYLGR